MLKEIKQCVYCFISFHFFSFFMQQNDFKIPRTSITESTLKTSDFFTDADILQTSVKPRDRNKTYSNSLAQSGPEGNINKGIPHTSMNFITVASPPDAVYGSHFFCGNKLSSFS